MGFRRIAFGAHLAYIAFIFALCQSDFSAARLQCTQKTVLCICLLQNMAVEIQSCTGHRVIQPPRNRKDIRSVVNQNAGHRVPERMGINMPQAMTLTEAIEPSVGTVWMHWFTVVPRKNISGFLPPISYGLFYKLLLMIILSQQIHRFSRDINVTLALLRFRGVRGSTTVQSQQGLTNAIRMPVK